MPTAEPVADTIFEAATDGKSQLRYLVGTDAEGLIEARNQMNDEQFRDMMKGNMGV